MYYITKVKKKKFYFHTINRGIVSSQGCKNKKNMFTGTYIQLNIYQYKTFHTSFYSYFEKLKT